MKQSRTAIKELTAAYRAVLKHAFIAMVGTVAVIGGASAGERTLVAEDDLYPAQDGMVLDIQDYQVKNQHNYAEALFFVSGSRGPLTVGAGSVFKNNVVESGVFSVSTDGTVLTIKPGTMFVGNHALADGGAIANFGVVKIQDSWFEGNTAQLTPDENGNFTVVAVDDIPVGGGALALGAVSGSDIASVTGTMFKENISGRNGGAIGTRLGKDAKNNAARLNIAAVFDGNHAYDNGGAIYNTFYANNGLGLGDGVTVTGKFVKNTAGKNGGAIFNDGALDKTGTAGGVMTINDSVFSENNAGGFGGGVFNTGTLTVNGGVFEENTAMVGGAISTGYNDKGVGKGSAEITGATFANNTAGYGGGAIANYGSLKIDNSTFANNKVTQAIEQDGWNNRNLNSSVDGGGALFLGSASSTYVADLNQVKFVGNEATTNGGAIATRADWVNSELGALQFKPGTNAPENYDPSKDYLVKNTKAKLDIKNSVFEQNKAGLQGGALFNTFMNTTIADSSFVGNTAGQGGAIYNAGAIELTGNNVFTGNMAGGVGNDIHNMGALTVAGGTTTIDGGITGNGTLTVADGATLNIGTATVDQETLHLDGTIGLTIVDANNYGKLLANTYADSAIMGRVSLTVATTGTYKIFNEGVNYTIVDAGAIYDVAQDDFGTGQVIISTKSVDKIAADTGLTDTAANTVAGLANSNNELANIASLNVQQALRDGDVDYVETETAKANPVDKPVVQSVAQSVQGAVMSLAANRMAGVPMAGRSGGDWSNADYGIWAQGMFNRSKFNGQFNGYTRGVAAGFDAQIAKQYTIGLGYAFGHSDVHANGGRNTEIDSNSVFAYAQYKPSNWYINGALNYTLSQYDEAVDAFGLHLTSDYDTNAFGAQVMTGYTFASDMTPEAGVRYLHVAQDSYNNGLTHVDSDDTDFLTGVAGLKYRFAIENGAAINWFPELRAAATYDFVSDRAMSTVTMPGAAAYVVDGDRLSRFGGEFGIGLTAEYNGLEISLTYDLDLHQDYTSQTGMAKFRYEF